MTFRNTIPVLVLLLVAGCQTDGKKTPTQRELAYASWNNARASVLYSLASNQYTNGNLDTCRKTLDEALKLEPQNVLIHVLSARVSIEQGRLEPAEKELQLARTLDPKNAEADYLSGVIYQRWQRTETALECYQHAAEKAPAELAYVLAQAEMLVALDRRAQAVDLLQERLTYFENSPYIRDMLGQLYIHQAKYAQGAQLLRQASILAADDLIIREHLALALYYSREYREAAAVLERLVADQRYVKRFDLIMALGECQLQTDRPRLARDQFELAAQLQPSAPSVWLNLAKTAMKLNDLNRAELSLRKAVSLDQAGAEPTLLLGYLRLRQGRLDEALAAFRRASLLDPEDTVSLSMCGYTLEKLGRSGEAIGYYAKALKMKPNDDLASTLMAQIRVDE